MPTGYTAGIIDGEITTFEQFATTCMRAFGATIHMRDEPQDKPYEPCTPTNYHRKKIEQYEGELRSAKSYADEEVIKLHRNKIEREISRHQDRITATKEAKERLCDMLQRVREWEPPTEDHQNFKEFMVDQLEKTIKFDGSSSYDEERIEELEAARDKSAEDIRSELIHYAEEQLEYHKTADEEERERCASANKWVEDLVNSLNPNPVTP